MMKLTKFFAIVLSLSALTIGAAQAITEGAYAGLGLGASKILTPDKFFYAEKQDQPGSQKKEFGGLGSRVFGGYHLNKNFGVEFGYAQYAKSKYSGSINNGDSASAKVDMDALDLVAKAYLPLGDGERFNLYALGGVAYVTLKDRYQSSGEGLYLASMPTVKQVGNGASTHHSYRPVYGVGASYDIPATKLTTGVEFSHIEGKGSFGNGGYVPSANLFTVNLAYNFG